MINIEDIMSGDYSSYPEDVQEFMKKYNERLREGLKEELIKDYAEGILKEVEKDKEHFINVLKEILDNGYKGMNNMSTRALLNTYLERKTQEDFFKLLERINEEL